MLIAFAALGTIGAHAQTPVGRIPVTQGEQQCFAVYRRGGAVPGTTNCKFTAAAAPVGMGNYYCLGNGGEKYVDDYCTPSAAQGCKARNIRKLMKYSDIVRNQLPKLSSESASSSDMLHLFFDPIASGIEDEILSIVSSVTHTPLPSAIANNASNVNKMINGVRSENRQESLNGAKGVMNSEAWSLLPPSLQSRLDDYMQEVITLRPLSSSEDMIKMSNIYGGVLREDLHTQGCPENLGSYGLPPYKHGNVGANTE